nr:hypothetical protein [Tanacetum cinerariifolium]
RGGLDVVVAWRLRLSHDGVTGCRHDGGSVVGCGGDERLWREVVLVGCVDQGGGFVGVMVAYGGGVEMERKRKHDDDEDRPAGPNQGKKTNSRRTKDYESSKKPSSTKETPKGKGPTKGSKIGKSVSAQEPVKEPIAELVMDNVGDDVARDDNQPQDTSESKTRKTLNPNWFKQPSRPPTPDPEWNKNQVVLDQPEQPWTSSLYGGHAVS